MDLTRISLRVYRAATNNALDAARVSDIRSGMRVLSDFHVRHGPRVVGMVQCAGNKPRRCQAGNECERTERNECDHWCYPNLQWTMIAARGAAERSALHHTRKGREPVHQNDTTPGWLRLTCWRPTSTAPDWGYRLCRPWSGLVPPGATRCGDQARHVRVCATSWGRAALPATRAMPGKRE